VPPDWGISIGIAFTAIGALIPEVAKTDSRGLAMGGYNSCIYLGMMLSSLGMGALVGDLGFRNCFFIVALINLVTTGVFQRGMRNSGAVRKL
jgi:MFS transporter, DHA1 family, multidrug resistance protein